MAGVSAGDASAGATAGDAAGATGATGAAGGAGPAAGTATTDQQSTQGTVTAAGGTTSAAGTGNGGATDIGVTATSINIANISDITGVVPGIFQSAQLATHGFRNQGDVHACQGSDALP